MGIFSKKKCIRCGKNPQWKNMYCRSCYKWLTR